MDKFISISLVTILVAILFESCCKEKDYMYFDGISLSPYMKKGTTQEPLNPDSTVSPTEFGIFIGFLGHYYSEGIELNNPFINKAYATEPCMDGKKGSKENIVSFSITSDADIDFVYPARHELNPLFKYRQIIWPSQGSPDTIWNVPDANLLEMWRRGQYPVLWFNIDNVKDKLHTFSVEVKLSDNRIFYGSTFQIRFK